MSVGNSDRYLSNFFKKNLEWGDLRELNKYPLGVMPNFRC